MGNAARLAQLPDRSARDADTGPTGPFAWLGETAAGLGAGLGGLWQGAQELHRMATGGEGRDIAREGTLTDPVDQSAVPLDRALAEGQAHGGGIAAWLMDRYAFGDQGTAPGDPLRVMVPGLNTPEPEASRRTAYYADVLGQDMLHLHNGTLGDADLPFAEHLDYAMAAGVRSGLKSTPLMDSLEQLLQANFSAAEPADIHAILYSDGTIGGARAIARFRRKEIARRMEGKGRDQRAAVAAQVDALLEEHLFVELHGNAVPDLPEGPRYLVWTDLDDSFSRTEAPLLGELGLHGTNQDPDNDRAVYVDYDGPFGGVDAHNLAAGGVHVVAETLRLNGVSSPQELWELVDSGAEIAVPERVSGDSRELWDPTNGPQE